MRQLLLIVTIFFCFNAGAQSPMFKLLAKKTNTAPFSPNSIAGCLLWVYADTLTGLSDNDPVSTWTDLSGNSNDATAAGGVRPLFKTGIQNSRAVLRFDGSDDFMSVANTSIVAENQGLTVFVVVKQASLTTNKAILCKWDYATDGTFAVQTSDASSDETMMYTADNCADDGSDHQNSTDADLGTNFYLLTYVFDGTQSNANRVKIYRNGTLLTMTTSGTLTTEMTSCSATLKIGSFGGALSRNWNGDMGEIVLYSYALNGTDQTNVENYLKAHWGL